MIKRIFHQRLEHKLGNHHPFTVRIDIVLHLKYTGISHLLDRQIIAYNLNLLVHRDQFMAFADTQPIITSERF
ncbi:hypothetical protein D3C74_496510 [compost metagenome]